MTETKFTIELTFISLNDLDETLTATKSLISEITKLAKSQEIVTLTDVDFYYNVKENVYKWKRVMDL